SLPAQKAPTAQPSKTEATANPVPAAWVPNAFARASTAPLITPLSKPKRKPPIAATQESAITYAELCPLAWATPGETLFDDTTAFEPTPVLGAGLSIPDSSPFHCSQAFHRLNFRESW